MPGHGTRKINEAYHLGGPKLVIETVRELLGIDINHVINVNFGGFRRAIDRLGCVYIDVDRRYFNDNTGPGPNYATIDLKPGYQKLCGRTRWTSCASATTTPTSSAPRASRRS